MDGGAREEHTGVLLEGVTGSSGNVTTKPLTLRPGRGGLQTGAVVQI